MSCNDWVHRKSSCVQPTAKTDPVFTENGNFILDTRFNYIDSSLEEQLKTITGVIESGLFIGYDVEVIMAE